MKMYFGSIVRFTVAAVLAVVFMYAPAGHASGGGINWYGYDEGINAGRTANKKIFLVFHADWCRYCKMMEKESFQNSAIIAYVNRHFIPISVNSDKEQKISKKYNVRGLPDTWFIAENGKPIGNRPGYLTQKELINMLKYIHTDSYKNMSFGTFLKKNGNP